MKLKRVEPCQYQDGRSLGKAMVPVGIDVSEASRGCTSGKALLHKNSVQLQYHMGMVAIKNISQQMDRYSKP